MDTMDNLERDSLRVSRARYDLGAYVELLREAISEYLREIRAVDWTFETDSSISGTFPRTVTIWYRLEGQPAVSGMAVFGPYPDGQPGLWSD